MTLSPNVKNQEKVKKPNRTTNKNKIISILILTLVLFLGVSAVESYFRKGKNATIEYNVTINPENKIISDYICLRNSKTPKEIADLIADHVVYAAEKEKVSTTVIVAIIEKESLFDPMAVSSAGAKGLMQVLRGEDIIVDEKQVFNIEYNLMTGISILKKKLKRNRDDYTLSLDQYSGYAKNYSNQVYECAGRFAMYKEKISGKQNGVDVASMEIKYYE